MNDEDLDYAREVLRHEAAAVEGLLGRIDEPFRQALELIYDCKGRVVVTGMGKAWLVGQKISATLASTGTPSLAMHAGEALHGDLGRMRPEDVAVVMSNSGRTRECVDLLGPLKKLGAKVIAITGDAESPLAENADVVIDIGNLDEACPMGLAPSTTTTAMLALGDALALTVLRRRDFGPADYALFHPGGSLGRKLMKVEDVMRSGPIMSETAPIKDALFKMTEQRAGAVSAVDADGKLVGIFTDGDLRRHLTRGGSLDDKTVGDLMTRAPTSILQGKLASEAQHVLQTKQIDEVPVVDSGGRPLGVVDVQDIVGTVH